MPSIPVHSLDFSANRGHQRASKKSAVDDNAEGSRASGSKLQLGGNSAGRELERDDTVYQPELSRKQKMKVCLHVTHCALLLRCSLSFAQQPQTQSANQAWAALPTIPSALLPQMKRDYQAMNLANSLDPKRFMKGGAKSTKIPENFAVSFEYSASRILR